MDRLRIWKQDRDFQWAKAKWIKLASHQAEYQYSLAPDTKMILYTDDSLSQLIYRGTFEVSERRFVTRFLRTGDVFVDVGANIGLYTLLASRVVGDLGRVYAFEPCHLTYERLVRNVALNGLHNVTCVQMALSDRAESRTLTVSSGEHMARNSLASPTAGSAFTAENVDCIDWDSFVDQHDLAGHARLMKIDVEGWEWRVLKGAQNALERPDAPDLLVEFTEANAQAAGTSCGALYRLLEGFGYRMYRIDDQKRKLTYDPPRTDYPYENLLATKDIDRVCCRVGFEKSNATSELT